MLRDPVSRVFTNASHNNNLNPRTAVFDHSTLSSNNLWLIFDPDLYAKGFFRESNDCSCAVKQLVE